MQSNGSSVPRMYPICQGHSGTLAAKYLVSFEPGKTRMKEFRLPEDTKKTLATYTRLWKQCICYIHRVSNTEHLGRKMFILKDDQAKIMEELWEQARIVVDFKGEEKDEEGKLRFFYFIVCLVIGVKLLFFLPVGFGLVRSHSGMASD